LFTNAYCSAPSCTPSRGAILTGKYHWQLEEGANLWSTLNEKYKSYPEVFENNGYYSGYSGEGWIPGMIEKGGRTQNPAGKVYNNLKNKSPKFISEIDYSSNFIDFLKNKPKEKAFCFLCGSFEPHLPYGEGIGLRAGKNSELVKVPSCLPDVTTIRSDMLDYFYEIEWYG
jgi:uncharacterized sulfatase